ncbi:uncharacterized protein G2W53_041409 [Senna tora]|uniref:Uncharacterized protein n=1 Tax=Senna tora TaxID=362788 RepID=A0A834SES8_9FABA|nr:uncharacterized protein G2W53_041409 [Senna tora]
MRQSVRERERPCFTPGSERDENAGAVREIDNAGIVKLRREPRKIRFRVRSKLASRRGGERDENAGAVREIDNAGAVKLRKTQMQKEMQDMKRQIMEQLLVSYGILFLHHHHNLWIDRQSNIDALAGRRRRRGTRDGEGEKESGEDKLTQEERAMEKIEGYSRVDALCVGFVTGFCARFCLSGVLCLLAGAMLGDAFLHQLRQAFGFGVQGFFLELHAGHEPDLGS